MRPPRGGGLSPEDRRLWARVAGSVTPRKGRAAEPVEPSAATVKPSAKVAKRPASSLPPELLAVARPAQPRPRTPEELEPRRQRRLARERDPIEARIDLHGHGRFQAQDALTAFLIRAQARGLRSVLVITGQGRRGGGVIRASVHEWLTAPALKPVVSGYAPAHRRHGGEGALYVALRRP